MSFQFESFPSLSSSAAIDEAEYIGDFDGKGESFDQMGMDPLVATEAKPGSMDKVSMLAARYAAGLPLWHDSDCYDHGPDGFPSDEFDD